MKNNALSVIFLFILFGLNGQIQGDGGNVIGSTDALQNVTFAKPDIKKLRAEDLLNDEKGNGPWRFGFNHETALSLENAGTWKVLPNGGKLWLLKVNCPEAQTINLTFENTVIPEGNQLFVYNEDKSFILGKFTQKHLYEGQLGTELVPGETIIVEYYVSPENLSNQGQLTLSTVTHGYRIVDEFQAKAFGQAGLCHMNVNCPDGTEFSNQKRSVVMIVSGANGLCTGALINNTQYDGRPYVLTANHCHNANVASWVFRFNWESPDCSNPGTEPTFTSLSGSTLRARRVASDFCLVEIAGGLESGTVPASFNAYFSGWDKSGDNPDFTFGIHHPRADIKKISFDDHPSSPTQSTISGVLSDVDGVWRVQWDRNTTTEPVSSGSPLFDNNKRIIGQLWGGQASCTNLNGPDYYGRIAASWNPSGSNSTNQLEYWLDPNGVGVDAIDGFEPGNLASNNGTLLQLKDIKGTICTGSPTPKLTLMNTGQTTLTSASITYGIDGTESQTYNWTGSLTFLQTVEITLPALTVSSGTHTFSATISTVNGGVDEDPDYNSVASTFFVMENPETIELNIDLDCYASETSWELKNSDDVVVYKSDAYINADEGWHNYEFCLSEDCYTFTVFDSYNDGMAGCSSGNGSFQIVNASNTILTEMTTSEANFTSSLVRQFCLGELSVDKLTTLFDIYPNPSSGIIQWNSNEIQSVKVLDLNGKEVQNHVVDLANRQLNLGELSNGMYIVEFNLLNNNKIQERIILSK